MNKICLLTGATGFIGYNTIKPLIDRGFDVKGVYHESIPNDSTIGGFNCDLFNFELVDKMMEYLKPKYLLHLAWYVNPLDYRSSKQNVRWMIATYNLIETFIKYGGERIVLAGSCSEYENRGGAYDEYLSPRNPNTLYGICKNSLFNLIQYSDLDVCWSWARVFYLYGAHENPIRFVPSVINGLLTKGEADATHCEQVRDFMYAGDVGDAFSHILDKTVEGPINIGSGHLTSLSTIANSIVRYVGQGKVNFGALTFDFMEPTIIVANTKKLNKLGWNPKVELNDGIKITVDYWRNKIEKEGRE